MSLRTSPSHFLISEPAETIGRIRRFLKNQRDRTGTTNFVLGMSGGLDSSVTAALCAQAIGGKYVIGVHMPERETRDENNLHDAKNVAEKFRIRFELVDITDLVMAASRTLSGMGWKRSPVPYGNVKPKRVYSKPASPGLWPGQTAEEELGLEYEKLDMILWGLERWMTPADIARGERLGIDG